jgi:hypothetical protein
MFELSREGGPSLGNLFVFTITGYYGFFCLFMLAVTIREKHIMHYCGFLKGVFMKSLFYVFLASLAFADIAFWGCWVVGCVFSGMAVLSWIGYCGKSEEVK